MGSVTAANVNDNKNLQNKSISNTSSKSASYNNSTVHAIKNVQTKKSGIVPGKGCCSVLVHVKNGYDVYSFRRDSEYTANLYLTKTKWYGKDALEEYKTTNGNFFHTIISKNGWIIGAGGPDIPYLNKQLMDLAGKTSTSGHITSNTINSATNILKKLGMGHFIIKAPNDEVGLVTYNGGSLKTSLFKMANGQYVSVPNSPSCYRTGFTSTTDPVASSIHLAMTDRWGVNRRNIMTYQVQNVRDLINDSTLIKIYASDSRGTPDNIVFNGKLINKYTIPRAPNKKLIGQIDLKDTVKIPKGLTGEIINGANIAYKTSFSSDGKLTTITFNPSSSTLHYQISSMMTSGIMGYGKYATVVVTGMDTKSRIMHKTNYYYNDLFIKGKLTLSSVNGNVFYNSNSFKKGSQIFEKISGKISSKITFNGYLQTDIGSSKGKEFYKNSSVNIKYLNNGNFYGTTLSKIKFYNKNYGGVYKVIKTATTSTTAYTNNIYTRKTGITSYYKRNSKGDMIGLLINGSSAGTEKIGTSTVSYNGKINIKPKHDARDIYNEGYVTGNYYEQTTSSTLVLNKITPLYESLII